MKNSSRAQSATSVQRAAQDEVSARSVRYLIMMGVRVACFILMIVVQPYGWYTWVFGAGAIFLPYIAVVLANVGQESNTPPVENPELAIGATPSPRPPATEPGVIRIAETSAADRTDAEPAASTTAPRAGGSGADADGTNR